MNKQTIVRVTDDGSARFLSGAWIIGRRQQVSTLTESREIAEVCFQVCSQCLMRFNENRNPPKITLSWYNCVTQSKKSQFETAAPQTDSSVTVRLTVEINTQELGSSCKLAVEVWARWQNPFTDTNTDTNKEGHGWAWSFGGHSGAAWW